MSTNRPEPEIPVTTLDWAHRVEAMAIAATSQAMDTQDTVERRSHLQDAMVAANLAMALRQGYIVDEHAREHARRAQEYRDQIERQRRGGRGFGPGKVQFGGFDPDGGPGPIVDRGQM